jgi:5-methylcytosine-specific restriction endonuclease McrA
MRVIRRDQWICWVCGVRTIKRPGRNYHPLAAEVDHVVRLSDGGAHSERNMRCSCARCNRIRNGRRNLEE